MTMQMLPSQFRKNNYDLRICFRDGKVAIYEQSDADGICGYEVIRIKVAKAGMVFGNMQPEREVYPSTEQWGCDGFTAQTLDRAHEIAQSLKSVAP